MAGGITFGASKATLATVVANGVLPDDARVLSRTNEAIKLILDNLIPVNGMMTADVLSTTGQVLLLPKELENAIEVQVLSGAAVNSATDVTQGWQLVSNFTYIDPASAHDNPLIDQGLVADSDPTILRRKYVYPGLAVGATVRVTGAKRYVPITADGDYLIVQNVRAIKLAILSIERDESSDQQDGDAYLQKAISLLEAEVRKHQMDPTNSLKRKAAYQADLTTYAEGTLGRTRARLALELQGFLARGKSEITYLVNRAVQMLVDNRNQLAITGRISIHGSTGELTYATAVTAATALTWNDYNQIRLMVQSFITESGDPQALAVAEEYQKKAFALQEAQLMEDAEVSRHTTYTTALATYTSEKLGYVTARLALALKDGLRYTTSELERLVDRAQQLLIDRRNQLAIAGRISVHGSVTETAYAAAAGPTSALAIPDFQQNLLMVQSFLVDDSNPQNVAVSEEYQKQAFALLEAQLVEATEKARHSTYTSALATYSVGTYGYTAARLALELKDGLRYTAAEITRFVERAQQMLVDNRNELAIAGRISVHGSVTELAYVSSSGGPTIALAWPDYNQNALLVQSFVADMADPQAMAAAEEYKKRGFELQQKQLLEAAEKERHSTYTTALTAYSTGTYGWTVARLSLDLENGLRFTTAEMNRFVERAQQILVDHRNQLNIAGRIGVHGSVSELAYVAYAAPTTVLAWTDYNQIQLLVKSFLVEGTEPPEVAVSTEYKKQALALQEAQLIEAAEKARHSTYTDDLDTYDTDTYGYTVARLALELPNGLRFTTEELTRLLNRAQQLLVDNRNQAAIAGRITVHESVTELAYVPGTSTLAGLAAVLAWPDYNDNRLMVLSFLDDAADPMPLQKQAFDSQEAKLLEESEKARHSTYTTALATYPAGSYGHTVARLALELKDGLRLTSTELERAADRAEQRLMERGLWRGTLEEFTADLVAGEVLFPVRVLGVLAADVCGMPVSTRAVFFDYQKNGPGKMCSCESRFTDMGEVYFSDSGNTRRRYRFDGNTTAQSVQFVAKLRWIKKENTDQMTIKSFEAIRLMSQALLLERQEKWQEAVAVAGLAVDELQKELADYLSGIEFQLNIAPDGGMSMGGIGSGGPC